MRVLEVVHGFPPLAQGGAEIYARTHARALLEAGDEVVVLTREQDQARDEYAVREEWRDGLRIVWVNNTFRQTRSFADTYRNETIAAIARRLIDDWRPDVAHIHHLTCLSTTIVDALAERRIPSFLTLHDYWLMCHRGQLLDTSYRVCDGPGVDGCASCLGAAGGAAPAAFAAASVVRELERRLPAGVGQQLRRASRHVAAGLSTASGADRETKARTDHMREVCARVTHFIAPSACMRDRFLRFGIPADRISVAGYGFDAHLFTGITRTESAALRIGFLGSLMVSKAPHVLLEAAAGLSPAATVTLFGAHVDYHGDASYRRALAPLLANDHVRLAGPIPPEDVPRALSEIDVLVVPSIWPENSPLVIREAFLAGVPVVATRIGGIVELIEDGVSGLLVEPGDSADLRRVLQRLIDEPALLPALRAGIPAVRSIQEDVRETRTRYRDAIEKVARHPPRRIAAIVLNYQTPDDTVLAVRSLLASRRRLDSVIVVDNDESPGPCERALAPLADAVTYIPAGGNLGFSGGMNVGIRDAIDRGADAVLLVNSDAIVPPDCVDLLERYLFAETSRGIVGPLLRSRAEPDRLQSAGMRYNRRTGRMRHRGAGERLGVRQPVQTGNVDGVSGCVMLIRREVLEAIGWLGEEYFFSFEDLEFCLRAREAGFSASIDTAASAYHEGSGSVGAGSTDRLYYATRNHLLMAERLSASDRPISSLLRTAHIVVLNLAHAALSPGASLSARVSAVNHGVRDFRRGCYGSRR
jgi:GT2 family glycosyltransferase/glycosyltransferase involved in cell wall biosynthesis